MLELPLIALYILAPILIPIAIVVFALRHRTKKTLRQLDEEMMAVRGEISRSNKELTSLKAQVGWLTGAIKEGIKAPEKPAVPEPVEKPQKKKLAAPPEPKKVVQPPLEYDFGGPGVATAESKIELAPESKRISALPPHRPTAWDRLASRLLENWTGVLGTIVLVAGIGFVGTYAALLLPPVFRFLLVLAAAGALYGGYMSLRGRENWEMMSLWLRSAAAAVLLFACAAAGGLPNAGLMWIDSAGMAIAVLLVGVAVNLALSWSVGYQGFAALHVLLALIPIAILPQEPLALGIATVISGFGVYLTYRQRWPIHLLTTMIVYLVFHIYWVTEQGGVLPLPGNLATLATASAAIVFLGAAMAPHSSVFRSGRLDLESVLTHLASWGMLVTLLVIHLRQVEAFDGTVLGGVLMAAALIAWIMSASAKRSEIEWLRTADVLIAQGLLLAGLFSWRSQFGEPVLFFGLIFIETLLFLRLVISDRGGEAAQVGAFVSVIAAVAFVLAGMAGIDAINTSFAAWRLAAIMFAGLCLSILAGSYFDNHYREQIENLRGPDTLLVVGILAGLMMVVTLLALFNQMLVGVVAMVAGAGLVFGADRLRSLGLVWGAWIILLAAHLIIWLLCFNEYAGDAGKQIALIAPVVVLTVFAVWKTPEHNARDEFRRAAIYLLGINLGIAAFLLLATPSALLPTVAWLVMSLVTLEIAGRISHVPAALPILRVGYGYIAAAAVGYTTIVLPTVSYLGSVNLRLAIEIFGMATLLYWWLAQPREPLASEAQWRRVQPYFLEMALALAATTVFIEVPLVWRPVAWLIIALLFLSPQFGKLSDRFAFYSLAAFITSVLAVTVNVSAAAVPSPRWFDQPWNTGLIAVVIQVAYLFLAYRRLALDEVAFPAGLQRLARLSRFLALDIPATICYPFFAGLALFLAWRFEQALLTFLWAFEAFVIFVLSIVFRENHFRFVALGGIAACLFRLVVYDMQETDLFIRGLVFIGVGLLMLAMNAVYNKYGAEVETE